jgi:small subunit ribosomal protein S21
MFDQKPRRKPIQWDRPRSQHIEVEVKGDDVMKAWRKLKKKLAKERVLEEVKERRYYQKPSEIKRETNKRLRRQAIRLRKKQQDRDGF